MDKPVDTRTQPLPFHGIGPMASDYTNETKKRKQEAIDKLKAAKATKDKKKQGKKAVKEEKNNKKAVNLRKRGQGVFGVFTEKIEELVKKYVKKYVVTRRRYTKKKKADEPNIKIYKRVYQAAYHQVYHKNCSPSVKSKAAAFAINAAAIWPCR